MYPAPDAFLFQAWEHMGGISSFIVVLRRLEGPSGMQGGLGATGGMAFLSEGGKVIGSWVTWGERELGGFYLVAFISLWSWIFVFFVCCFAFVLFCCLFLLKVRYPKYTGKDLEHGTLRIVKGIEFRHLRLDVWQSWYNHFFNVTFLSVTYEFRSQSSEAASSDLLNILWLGSHLGNNEVIIFKTMIHVDRTSALLPSMHTAIIIHVFKKSQIYQYLSCKCSIEFFCCIPGTTL